MRVAHDCESAYQSQLDPWSIGDASAPRYERYEQLLAPYAQGSVLDIGCGFGAFLARFRKYATSLDGVDLSHTAVRKGAERFPFIDFHQGSGSDLQSVAGVNDRRFDLIICSDVINYFADSAKRRLLDWIAAHLTDDGRALVAAWSPGGKYLTSDELVDLVQKHFVITHSEELPTGHVALVVQRRRRLVALTIDYETWHPIPDGKRIDWQADIFGPTDRLLELFEATGVKATFFAEMGEYLWLQKNDPTISLAMEEQWRKAVAAGHDVQLHLHPNWLPELGARRVGNDWDWDWSKAKADDYPGDLTELIRRCRTALEVAIHPVLPSYKVTTFRAGAYQAQPFTRLSRALIENGIVADSSVFAGGQSEERGYDYQHAYSRHQPYFADLLDPQLRAIPAEERILELPIFTSNPSRRWFLDGAEADVFAERLIEHDRRFKASGPYRYRRFVSRLRNCGTLAYSVLSPYRSVVNRALPRVMAHALAARPRRQSPGHHYYVAIGHTKADLRYATLKQKLVELKRAIGVEYVTISAMAKLAATELRTGGRDSEKEMEFQVQRESKAILGDQRNFAQSDYLQQMIPLDCDSVLDFGCGAGYWSKRIADLYPWVHVTGIDAGAEFIEKARRSYKDPRIRFTEGDFTRMPFADESFTCVYADNTLEHSFDVDGALAEIRRVLKDGGSLVAAIPLDGVNPDYECDNHTWKTTPIQALDRIRQAGFSNIHSEVVNTFRQLGMSPYAPSNDLMLYVRAWKVSGGDDALKRVRRAMDWTYRRLEPSRANLSVDPVKIISEGYGLCIASAVALGGLLKREHYDVTWVTMIAEDHQRGSGPRGRDSHQVVEINIDGRTYVLDPMANTIFPHSLQDLLKEPRLADPYTSQDGRGKERNYELYNTSYWYERVTRFARRKNPRFPVIIWKRHTT